MALLIIITLYVCVGLLAAVGSIFIAQKVFSVRAEQIFFALFLVAIAGFYLVFAGYFEDQRAWRLETEAVIVFAMLGISVSGCRLCSSLATACTVFGMCFMRFMLLVTPAHSALRR